MNLKIILFITCFCSVILVISAQDTRYAYTGTYVPKIIQSHGYPVEIHEVITEDGYVIELHRIPHGIHNRITVRGGYQTPGGGNESYEGGNESYETPGGRDYLPPGGGNESYETPGGGNQTYEGGSESYEIPGGGRKKVAILSHCIFCSSSAFVVLGPQRALAYMLADDGYDVWMLNSRGTKASRKHLKFSQNDSQYWKFSWSDQGIYDVSSMIDYTLKVTGESQVDYIAFSMGNAQLFALLSERPQYNKKIRTVIAMAPAIFMNSSTGFFPARPPMSSIFLHNGLTTGDLQFPPKSLSVEIRTFLSGACNPVLKPLFTSLCHLAFTTIGGNINGNVDEDSLYYYFKFFPDTTSLRTMMHYSQLRMSGQFQKYSFGTILNWKIYGSPIPPNFDLNKSKVPVNILYSYGDTVTNYKDIERFGSELPNVVHRYQIPFRTFSHMDFIWGKNAPIQVYREVLERLHVDYS